jgi:hypothetical protein
LGGVGRGGAGRDSQKKSEHNRPRAIHATDCT